MSSVLLFGDFKYFLSSTIQNILNILQRIFTFAHINLETIIQNIS